MKHSISFQLNRALEVPSAGGKLPRLINLGLMALILLNVVAVIAHTVPEIQQDVGPFLNLFGAASMAVFTLEYVVRLWVAPLQERFEHPFWGRVKMIFSPLMLVDLITLFPFYIPALAWLDLRFLRTLRLFHLSLTFKTVRQSESVKSIQHVLKSKKMDVFVTMFVALVVLVIGSCIMYFVEREAQPQSFGTIPQALWWGVITISTIGYGDIHPITPLGKMVGSLMALSAIGIIALPAGVLSSILAEEVRRLHHRRRHCPHCGQSLTEDTSAD